MTTINQEEETHRKFAIELLSIRKDAGCIMKVLLKEHPEEANKLYSILERTEPIRKYHFEKYIKIITKA